MVDEVIIDLKKTLSKTFMSRKFVEKDADKQFS